VSRVGNWLRKSLMFRHDGRVARTGRPKAELVLTDDERETLSRWARRRTSSQALALRCRIVLECATGAMNRDVAALLGVEEHTVGKWRAPRAISEPNPRLRTLGGVFK